MDEWVNRWIDEWIQWTDRQTDGWINRRLVEQMGRKMWEIQ